METGGCPGTRLEEDGEQPVLLGLFSSGCQAGRLPETSRPGHPFLAKLRVMAGRVGLPILGQGWVSRSVLAAEEDVGSGIVAIFVPDLFLCDW